MITVGFTLIGGGAWSGGENYQRNMLGVMASELAGKVRAKLFLTAEQYNKIGTTLDDLLCEPAIVDERVAGAGAGRRALSAIITGSDTELAKLVTSHNVDVMFESARWFGNSFPVPVVSWIPDFQHRCMSHLFSGRAWCRRDIGFRIQTSGKRVIMLSSNDALADCERFYPASRGKTQVVRFVIDLDIDSVFERASEVRRAFGLPERFFYLPNQFWSHKNHQVVVEALERLRLSGDIAAIPPVILTGRKEDPRDSGLYKRLMTNVTKHGLESHFRHIGLIPYEDVLALNAACDHLINPSLFEGWSTTVEEAKSLGTPMVLSDISIHREQALGARFFERNDSGALAGVLRTIASRSSSQRRSVEVLRAEQIQRRDNYAIALFGVFEKALANRVERK